MSGLVTPPVVRFSVLPEREYSMVLPFSSTNVMSVELGMAVTLWAERSSRAISSRATRPFC